MSLDVFLALLLFAFVSSITPGPNNLMLLASGVNFGFLRTIPHMLGIGVGFLILLLAVGLGLGALLTAYPPIQTALKVAGGAYLLYLAWKIAMARTMGNAGATGAKPMTFRQAAVSSRFVSPAGERNEGQGITPMIETPVPDVNHDYAMQKAMELLGAQSPV